ncbi:hydrolase TatD [Helicobacter monodelphidis]|nr:hydrolase TatD [Helicobacter sp. 15-1451]
MYDTHCHLDAECFFADLPEVIENSIRVGVDRFIIPGADLRDLQRAQEISQKYTEVYFAAGIHPYHIDDYDEDTLESFIQDKKCIAIGECGLDYFRLEKGKEEEIKEAQKRVFLAQISLALKYKKPIILHIRDSSNDAYEILKPYMQELKGVLHCYNADSILLNLAQNFYYGIGGVLTFKNAKRLVEILPKIPIHRILLETDAPYLTPEPHRGKRNSPEFIPIIAQKIADLCQKTQEEIEIITNQNADTLFWQTNH